MWYIISKVHMLLKLYAATVGKEEEKLSLNRPWRNIGVFCEVRTSSAYKKKSYPHNRPWRSIGVFHIRYQHHLHIKNKSVPITGRARP
jgi:hypothetical protein